MGDARTLLITLFIAVVLAAVESYVALLPTRADSSREVEIANLRVQIAHLAPKLKRVQQLRDQNVALSFEIAFLELDIKQLRARKSP